MPVSDPGILDEAVTAAATGSGVGGGFFALRWLVQWLTGRLDKRQALLDAQDERVDREWQKIREKVEARLDKVELQNEALRFAFHHVAAALIKVDPTNPALAQAEQMLSAAFPLDLRLMTDRAEIALARDELERRV
ncbi:hypothetical protein FHS95_000151 [Sphingomonas naasensis]|uniref:Uncharacterized protein n=1 Tax=Sphingomonas naasensis TaxID=1344951 RepID=A0A4S1WQW7_9SPHN|nr:hypothetical protein [Sphingomonas naasensis]NIJ18482.1 hypothetical protein [Sphingomonas naasensis]TGX45739.1 hypothetical protein E5A74_00720 [Sphingomonas naasensis]